MAGKRVIECSFSRGSSFAWRVEWTRGKSNSVKWFTDGVEMKEMINTMDDLGWAIVSRDIYQKVN